MTERDNNPDMLLPENRELTDDEADNLIAFAEICLKTDTSFAISYDNGRTFDSENFFDPDGNLTDFSYFNDAGCKQGPQGFRVQVDGIGVKGDDGKEIVSKSMDECLSTAIGLLYRALTEKENETFAKQIIEDYMGLGPDDK